MTITVPQVHRIHGPSWIQAIAAVVFAAVAFVGVRQIVVDDVSPAKSQSVEFSTAATSQFSAVEELELIEGFGAGAAGVAPVEFSAVEELELIEGFGAGAAGVAPVEFSAVEELELIEGLGAGAAGVAAPGTWVGKVR